mmetsp:Transcript_3645/g.9091  ORF Transcript_3645/g.9091 Transcript_3645/m.9091 type:complete len:254 (-) Transcript_3645:491-1252(-)
MYSPFHRGILDGRCFFPAAVSHPKRLHPPVPSARLRFQASESLYLSTQRWLRFDRITRSTTACVAQEQCTYADWSFKIIPNRIPAAMRPMVCIHDIDGATSHKSRSATVVASPPPTRRKTKVCVRVVSDVRNAPQPRLAPSTAKPAPLPRRMYSSVSTHPDTQSDHAAMASPADCRAAAGMTFGFGGASFGFGDQHVGSAADEGMDFDCGGSLHTSASTNVPPGFVRANAVAKAAGLSVHRLKTPLDMTRSAG